jgi:2-polyprenyl-3-methyl-5-hydroxy-6-metoxy-1,4-benzoquinol methylase
MNRFEVILFGRFPYKWKKFLFHLWFKISKAGKVSNNGERWVAGTWDDVLNVGEFYGVMHAHRYVWAHTILPSLTSVLDLGCGTGYGSWYFASQKHKTLGFDPDKKSIDWAKSHFKHENLTFTTILKSITYFNIVSFEALEHAPKEVEESFTKHLATNGTLIISTANGTPNSVRSELIKSNLVTLNPGHVKEFTVKELKLLLEKHFKHIEIFGQCIKNVYSFKDWNEWRKKTNVKITDYEMRKDDFINCEVLVAVCTP